jgi:hypothetical protein
MTPIERAARALCEMDGYDPDTPHRAGFQTSVTMEPVPAPPLWSAYVPKVRAVLTAIRAPGSDAMGAVLDKGIPVADALDIWQTVVDAMLREAE